MKKWSEKTTLEKVAEIISGIAIVVWFVFCRLEGSDTVKYAEMGSYISLCVVCVCEAIAFWNQKRALSYVAIIGMTLMLTAVILLAL